MLWTRPIQVARLTWWTRHDKPSDTDVMEEARDEEIEKQEITEDSDEIEMQDIAAEKEEEKDENAVTEETPAVDTVHHSKL